MAGQIQLCMRPVGIHFDVTDSGENVILLPLRLDHAMEAGERDIGSLSGEDQRGQATRSATPSAASSGPWPHTSPMTARIVPSSSSMASKKSPPNRTLLPPGR